MKSLGIIGIGKLGVCFALNAERKGFEVLGVDVHQKYVDQINNKTLASNEPLVKEYLNKAQNLKASTKLEDLIDPKFTTLFVFVATPSLPDGSYDHSQIERVSDKLISFGERKETVNLVIGCTTMPGYCDALAQKMAPYNYTVSYNPEFIAQGNIILDQQQPDQVLIGEANETAGNRIQEVYERICDNSPTFCRMDRLSAEIAKIATNCFLTTKISFANSIGDLAIQTGADKDKILKALGADSRIGAKYLNYGFGFGGPCFPRDNRALGKFASENNYRLLISEATDEVNKRHLDFQLKQLLEEHPEGSTVTFDGVSYKKGSILLDESQQLALALALHKKNRKVLIRDLKEVIEQVEKLYPNLFTFEETQ
jgi:nucleotide sugar dehydrogenase